MPPLTLMIKPASGLCDLRCEYCFYADVSAHREIRSYGVMSVDTLETLVRRAFLYAEGQLSFMFQGGEPTVAGKAFFRHFLKLEAEYKDRPVRVLNAIQTNGYALDEEWCEIFKEGSFLVGVSLDGTREIHDTYRKTADKSPTYDRIAEPGGRFDHERKRRHLDVLLSGYRVSVEIFIAEKDGICKISLVISEST